ncbi:Uncharacterised protein [Neisseria meningitidis]|nr:Uncharacterised protein [Neisseria meningitidis]CWU28617.1 Uncharacterised protein [Neisseria meningitidis]
MFDQAAQCAVLVVKLGIMQLLGAQGGIELANRHSFPVEKIAEHHQIDGVQPFGRQNGKPVQKKPHCLSGNDIARRPPVFAFQQRKGTPAVVRHTGGRGQDVHKHRFQADDKGGILVKTLLQPSVFVKEFLRPFAE